MRYGGPKWIPRGGIPIRRRRPRGAWIVNGQSAATYTSSGASSLWAPRTGGPGTGYNPLTIGSITLPVGKSASTDLAGHLVTTFDAKEIEDSDLVSVNQVDSLSTQLRVRKLQGFLEMTNATETRLRVGYLVTKSISVSEDNIDQIDFADPTLWRSSKLVAWGFDQLTPNSELTGNPGRDHVVFKLNLRTRVRLAKNETLSLWTFVDAAGSGSTGVVASYRWAMRSFAVRA